MTKEEKIKFLAELDNWEPLPDGYFHPDNPTGQTPPRFLGSYDVIIPLIQKQPRNILTQIVLSMKGQNDVSRMVDWQMYSPEELADILIKVIKNNSPK